MTEHGTRPSPANGPASLIDPRHTAATWLSFDEKKWRTERTVSIVALAVSIGALIVSFASLLYDISPGTVRPLRPSGYAIIRGFGVFPSDYLVLPLEWQNTSGTPVLVRHPYLLLAQLDDQGRETGVVHRFTLEGEYPEISAKAFAEYNVIERSFSLEPRSLTRKVLIFHVEGWWDHTEDQFDFQFRSGERYRVYVGFYENLVHQEAQALFDLEVYPYADKLVHRSQGGDWWDYWSLPEKA